MSRIPSEIKIDTNASTIRVDDLTAIVDILASEFVYTKKEMLNMTVEEIIEAYIEFKIKQIHGEV